MSKRPCGNCESGNCAACAGLGPAPARSLPEAEFQRRLRELLKLRRKLRLDAILLSGELNVYYFTGILSDNASLLVTAEGPVFRTDRRYLVMAKRVAPWLSAKPLPARRDEQAFLAKLARRWTRVGYEASISAGRYLELHEALASAELVDVEESIAQLRAVKSPREIGAIRQAVMLNDAVFQTWAHNLAAPATEWEISRQLRGLMDYVAQGEAFDTIVCVGKTAAECHHAPGEATFAPGRTALVDMGVKSDFYCSDMTRSFCWGRPTKEYADLRRLVSKANRAAIAKIRPGVRCSEIDAVARRLIEKAGYGDAFWHSLGHAFGLYIHESPVFSPSCDIELKPGMVMTVEPGIYIAGRLGIRVEDDVLVTATGCEVLSRTPHDCDLPL